MALYAIVVNGVVANIAVSDTALESNWFLVDQTVKIGDTKDGDVYTSPLPSEDAVRRIRDMLLVEEVDPLATNNLRWNALTDAQRAAWTQYRTDLLNVPQQAGFPHNVTWPTQPE